MTLIKTLLFVRHLTYFQAAVWATFGYLMFSISDSFGKFLLGEGFHKSTILVINSIPSVIVLSVWAINRHGLKRAFHTRYKTLHVMRGLALTGVTFFAFEALSTLTLTAFYGITFSAPFFITLGAAIIFKERVDLKEWLAILIGFSGVIIIVNPDYSDFNIGYIYALLTVICISSAAMIVRKIGRDENPTNFVIFSNIAIILANIIPATQLPVPDIEPIHIAILALYSISIPISIFTVSAVFSRAPAVSAVAPYQYLQIIWGTVIGYLFFAEIPQENSVMGSIVVIGCGLYILHHHSQKRRRDAKNLVKRV